MVVPVYPSLVLEVADQVYHKVAVVHHRNQHVQDQDLRGLEEAYPNGKEDERKTVATPLGRGQVFACVDGTQQTNDLAVWKKVRQLNELTLLQSLIDKRRQTECSNSLRI